MKQSLLRYFSLSLLVTRTMFLCAQDFEIKNFHENITDLTAAVSDVRDGNNRAAALIRFTMRDPQFVFDANMGIIRTKQQTGEMWIFVPEGTKRITVRHPLLGVLRDYVLPVAIKGKTTYDADIVITNVTYMESLYSQQPNQDIAKESEVVVEKQSEPQPSSQIDSRPEPVEPAKQIAKKTITNIHFAIGAGFNALSLMGPSVNIALRYKVLVLEGGFVLGLDKVENITFTRQGESSPSEAYDYSCNRALVRVGGHFSIYNSLYLTPFAGISFNMIKGKSVISKASAGVFEESNPMSGSLAVRLSYEVAERFYLHLTPQYDFSIGGDGVFSFIKNADSKLKSWGEGFGLNVGIMYEF